MRYAAVFFDWGDTLSPVDKDGVPILSTWAGEMIRNLYNRSYRLAIISNTHRYQDGFWIREQLAKHGLLHYFEVVISSATYAVHKPNPLLFDKALAFMQLQPGGVVMVGDHEHCDGAARHLWMDYMKVRPDEKWDSRLYAVLEDETTKRKLSPLYEFSLREGRVRTKLRHFSTPVTKGDLILLNQDEYEVTESPHVRSMDQILTANDEFVEFGVRRTGDQFNL